MGMKACGHTTYLTRRQPAAVDKYDRLTFVVTAHAALVGLISTETSAEKIDHMDHGGCIAGVNASV